MPVVRGAATREHQLAAHLPPPRRSHPRCAHHALAPAPLLQVRCIAMDATDGLTRGQGVVNTGEPIKVPVGRETLGRIMNVIGEPVDEKDPIREWWRPPCWVAPLASPACADLDAAKMFVVEMSRFLTLLWGSPWSKPLGACHGKGGGSR